MTRPTIPPTVGRRIVAAVALACIAAVLAFLRNRPDGPLVLPNDYTYHWWAGDALRRGYSPYAVINAWSPIYPYLEGYPYWLSTALLLEPLAYLPIQWAMVVFTGISAGVFTFALTRDGWWRLPFLASLPFTHAMTSGQVTPFVVAAMLWPSLGWLAPMKYTMGSAGFAYTLSRRYAVLAVVVVALSIAIAPWWPVAWWHELSDMWGHYYHVPILVPGGALPLLALLRWRRPEARLVAVTACLPQIMLFYDQLSLLLVARTYRQALTMTLLSWLPIVGVAALHHGAIAAPGETLFAWNAPVIVWLYFVPCAAIVVTRPNRGDVPTWLERLSERLPRWLAGTRENSSPVESVA